MNGDRRQKGRGREGKGQGKRREGEEKGEGEGKEGEGKGKGRGRGREREGRVRVRGRTTRARKSADDRRQTDRQTRDRHKTLFSRNTHHPCLAPRKKYAVGTPGPKGPPPLRYLLQFPIGLLLKISRIVDSSPAIAPISSNFSTILAQTHVFSQIFALTFS